MATPTGYLWICNDCGDQESGGNPGDGWIAINGKKTKWVCPLCWKKRAIPAQTIVELRENEYDELLEKLEFLTDEYDELLEKLEFLTEENKQLREQDLKTELDREEARMQELDQFREGCLTWWHCIEQAMKLYEASLGNEHRLRHERGRMMREIEELRKQVGVVAVYDERKAEDDEEKKKSR